MSDLTVAVIISPDSSAAHLPECLQSVVGQIRRPDEILVIAPHSSDEAVEIAGRFAGQGVRFLRVDQEDPITVRNAGLECTESNIVCYVDAGDLLEPDYLSQGIGWFGDDSKVAVVYSDVEYLSGDQMNSNYPMSSEEGDIFKTNFIHSGSLVRRDVLEVTTSHHLQDEPDCPVNWATWRKIVGHGFRAVKQRGIFRCRIDRDERAKDRIAENGESTYFASAGLADEVITLFLLLTGNSAHWIRCADYLSEQGWPHNQVCLVLADASDTPEFSSKVRRWLADSDYEEIHYSRVDTCESEEGQPYVRVLNKLRGMVRTPYLWLLQESVEPRKDEAERLLFGFCNRTVSVRPPVVAGSPQRDAFECTMVRSSEFREISYPALKSSEECARYFYSHIDPGLVVRIEGEPETGLPGQSTSSPGVAETQNVTDSVNDAETLPSREVEAVAECSLEGDHEILEHEFDEEFYIEANPDVQAAIHSGEVSSGYEHYKRAGLSEGRAARERERICNLPPLQFMS